MDTQTISGAAPTTPQTTTTIGDASAALALADSSLATPAPDTTATSDAPAATQQAQSTGPTQVPVNTGLSFDPKKGIRLPNGTYAPPEARWPEIQATLREQAKAELMPTIRAELQQEYEQRLKPYEGVDEQTLAGYRVLRAAESGDARARAHIARLNPQLAQAMGWTQTPQADAEPEPDFVLPVKDAQGNIVGERAVYSAEQLAKREAWNERRLLSKVDERVKPFQDLHERDQKAQNNYRAHALIDRYTKQYPEFEQHVDDVIATINGDPRLADLAKTNPEAGMEIAWSRVHRTKVLPSQQQSSEAKVLTDLQQRAVAAHASAASTHTATPTNTLGDARAALAYATQALGPS